MAGEELLDTMQHQVTIAYHLCRKLHGLDYELRDVDGPVRMAELGVATAMTSNFLMDLFPQLHMTLVDIQPYPDIVDLVRRHPTRVKFCHGTTAATASQVPDNSLDLIFIDAQHTYENVNEDIRNWAPKLKDTGIMGGHDLYDRVYPGVRKAVEEIGVPYESGPGHTWWFTECPKHALNREVV